MSRAKQFERELHHLYLRRTASLRRILRGKHGRVAAFTKQHRDKAIERLQSVASEALVNELAREVFDQGLRERRSWQILPSKGRGVDEKKRSFASWFERKVGHKNCVYVFWRGKRCVYVGKTTIGASRPLSHFDKFWFQPVRRVDVYATRGRRSLPAMECVAIHRFQPRSNKVRAAARKFAAKCPLCRVRRQIKRELRAIFRL